MLFETPEATILFWLVIGAAGFIAALLHLTKSEKGSVGFPIAMLLALATMHCGAVVHLSATYFHQYDPYLYSIGYTRNSVARGLQVSTIGFLAMIAGIWLTSHIGQPYKLDFDASHYPARFLRLAERVMLTAGLIFFTALLVAPGLAGVPTFGAVVVSGKNLLPVALCIAILRRVWLKEGLPLWSIAALSTIIPLANLLGNAILAEAVSSVMFIGCFWIAVAGRRMGAVRLLLAIVAASYAFLFLSTNYLLVRGQFRDIVWEETSTFQDRVKGLGEAFAQFKPLSSEDERQLFVLDARMNQSAFTGMAVERLMDQPDGYENGSTLVAAVFAFVPRIIWTTKPVRGGSQFVATHTGYRASNETSFGIGPFFEFYVNFGLAGVIILSMLYGALIRAIDIHCFRALVVGKMTLAVPLMTGALALIQPLASMSSIFSNFYAALILGFIVAKMLERYLSLRTFFEDQARAALS